MIKGVVYRALWVEFEANIILFGSYSYETLGGRVLVVITQAEVVFKAW